MAQNFDGHLKAAFGRLIVIFTVAGRFLMRVY